MTEIDNPSPEDEQNRLLSLEAAARILGVERRYLRYLVGKGGIDYYQAGKHTRIRFTRKMLADHIESNTHRRNDPDNPLSQKVVVDKKIKRAIT